MSKQSQAMIAILMLLTLACQNPPPSAPATPPETSTSKPVQARDESEIAIRKALFAQRRAAQKRWLDAAKMVAEKTADPVAMGISAWMNQNALLGQPSGDGTISQLEYLTTQTKPFLLIIILPVDVLQYPELGIKISSTSAATFNPSPPHITLYPQPVSEIWQGLLLLHEGAHASQYLSEPYDVGDPELNALREVAVHEFSNRLLAKIGGPEYMSLLDLEIMKIKSDRAAAKPAPDQLFLGIVSPYDERLDQIFGPCRTDFEKATRRLTLFTHASFELINREFGADSNEAIVEKTDWYMNVKAKLNNLPTDK
jgi:hypothetical protein